MAVSEASDMIANGAVGSGCTRSVALARASFAARKAPYASSVHASVLVAFVRPLRRSLRGRRSSAACGRKR